MYNNNMYIIIHIIIIIRQLLDSYTDVGKSR